MKQPHQLTDEELVEQFVDTAEKYELDPRGVEVVEAEIHDGHIVKGSIYSPVEEQRISLSAPVRSWPPNPFDLMMRAYAEEDWADERYVFAADEVLLTFAPSSTLSQAIDDTVHEILDEQEENMTQSIRGGVTSDVEVTVQAVSGHAVLEAVEEILEEQQPAELEDEEIVGVQSLDLDAEDACEVVVVVEEGDE